MQIPMLDLKREYAYLQEEIDAAMRRCFSHQQWILGPEVKEFEMAAAQYLNARHCVGVASGTDALVLALRALAIQRTGKEYFDAKDEIITTPFTFTATGDAILRAGATPVFVDIDPKTYNIDPEKIGAYCHSSTRGNVVGIIPVHLYGQACNMDVIVDLAKKCDLFVLEDCAQAFGAGWREKKSGTLGTMGAYSFFPSKPLGGCGDGGMVATQDDTLAELVRMLVSHGGKNKYNVEHIGYNARLDTIQAAILLAKLNYVDEFNRRRVEIAELYNKRLAPVAGITVPIVQSGAKHVYHQYTVRVNEDKREAIRAGLARSGIATMVYYPALLSDMAVFQQGRSKAGGTLACATEAVCQVINLPIGPFQTKEETEYIIDLLGGSL